jgi:hypothetical protein
VKLTPFRLIVLRAFNVTFGRSATCDALLRRLLLALLVKRAKTPYGQSSRFFTPDELGPGGQ